MGRSASRAKRACAILCLLCGVLLAADFCHAQPKPAGDSTSASPAAAAPAADYPQLAAAYRKSPSPQIILQLGVLALQTGRTIEAQDLMRRYLADLNADPTSPAYKEAEQVVAKPRGPSGEVEVLGERGAFLSVDERLVGALPLTLPLLLSVGEHQVLLEHKRKKVKAPIKIIDGRGSVMRFNLDGNAVLVSQPPAVVILPEVPAIPQAPRLLQQVEKAVRRANLAVFNTDVALAKAKEQAACRADIECQIKLGRQNEIDYVLSLRISTSGAPNKADYQYALKLLDVSIGDFSASGERACKGCDIEQGAVELSKVAEELLSKGVARAHGTLVVESEPPGATVKAGEQTLGTTPLRRETWTGTQQLLIALSGYQDEKVEVKVPEGSTGSVKLTLKTGSGSAEQSSGLIFGRPRKRFIAGAAIAGSGIIILGIGIGVIRSGCLADPLGLSGCDSSTDPATIAGASMIGIGALLGGIGGLVMGIPGKPSTAPK